MTPAHPHGVSRRGLIGGGTAAAGAAVLGLAAGRVTADTGAVDVEARRAPYAFRGAHQAGIITPAQDLLHFAAFDVVTHSRDEVEALLRAWTDAAERLVRGLPAGPIGPTDGADNLPPDDTGEAIGLPASGLTLTFGFGPSLFTDEDGRDRFGLADRRPEALEPLPHFPADNLDPAKSHGDLCVQACADDPQVAVHAIRNLARIGFGTVSVRWSQLGFGRTSTTSTSQSTPRNLFGFKDGTANVKAEETLALDEHLWVQPEDDAGWLAGGSYLVTRRIGMTIEVWDRQPLRDQEEFVGRTKDSGAPLSGGEEFTEPDFDLPGRDGPIIPADAHVRIVHPDEHGGARMLRRGYNFVDGTNDIGGLDAGLFFIAYVRDPRTHFIPVQNAMAKNDSLMEYLKFTSSAIFAVPPGLRPGEYVGESLFG
ncbi:MAG: iron uptake transporter deferrochelatase/peroxidase subunit [Nocardioides sp.]